MGAEPGGSRGDTAARVLVLASAGVLGALAFPKTSWAPLAWIWLVPALVSGLTRPRRAALLDGLFYPRSEATAKMIRQAQAAGRLRKDVPAHVIVDLLVGPLFYRMFVRHQPLNDAFVSRVFQCVVSGLEKSD